MTFATWFLLAWIICLAANLVSWMRSLSWRAQPPPPFFYSPASAAGTAVSYVFAIAVLVGSLAAILQSRSDAAAQIAVFLHPFALYAGLCVLCCYSLWRRHAKA